MNKSQNKPVTIDVGIAAFNAERNIVPLITALKNQSEESFILRRIIVHSDHSTDDTDKLVKDIKDKRISHVISPRQEGFANSLKNLFSMSKADITVLLNDDIKIRDPNILNKISKAFSIDTDVGLVAGRPLPYYSNSFLSKAIMSGFRAYDKTRLTKHAGHNIHTMDGKIFAVSQKFRQQIAFADDVGKMGNVDSFIYLQCLLNGFKYRYANDAVVYYKNPATMHDYLKWYIRNTSNKHIQSELFGSQAQKEFTLPLIPFVYHRAEEFFKNPAGALFIVMSKLYILYKAKKYSSHFDSTLSVFDTTKRFRKRIKK